MKLILACACFILVSGVSTAMATTNTTVSPELSTVPKITSVSKITTAKLQTITIRGTGFGTWHHYTGTSRRIQLRVYSGNKILWEAGYSPDLDTVTLIVQKWTNTEIVLGGFAGAWGKSNFRLHKGNVERVEVWNWQTGKGPAEKKVIVE